MAGPAEKGIISTQSKSYDMQYTAIFLDMDHTLCDTARADLLGTRDFQKELAKDFEPDRAEQIAQTYLHVIYGERKNEPGYRQNEGESDVAYRGRLLQYVLEEAGTPVPAASILAELAQRFMDLRIKHFDFFPGVMSMLKRLRNQYTLVLVTNGPPFSQEPKLQRVQMTQYMDHILLGGLLPRQKPHPSIFSLACRKAGCKTSQAVHVGDMLSVDIQGAANAGITSIWLNPEAQPAPIEPVPDHTISHITELEELLNRINQ